MCFADKAWGWPGSELGEGSLEAGTVAGSGLQPGPWRPGCRDRPPPVAIPTQDRALSGTPSAACRAEPTQGKLSVLLLRHGLPCDAEREFWRCLVLTTPSHPHESVEHSRQREGGPESHREAAPKPYGCPWGWGTHGSRLKPSTVRSLPSRNLWKGAAELYQGSP